MLGFVLVPHARNIVCEGGEDVLAHVARVWSKEIDHLGVNLGKSLLIQFWTHLSGLAAPKRTVNCEEDVPPV